MNKNIIIGGSMRGGKTTATNGMSLALHGDDIRKSLLSEMNGIEKDLLFPKFSNYLEGKFTFEQLLKTLTIKDYLRVEQYENGVVYDRGIKNILESWIDKGEKGNIIEGVQLMPERLVETLKGKEDLFRVVYLVKTDYDKVMQFVNNSFNPNIDDDGKNFVSKGLQNPLLNNTLLRETFADLIVAYGKEVEYVAKNSGFKVIETSGEKAQWLQEIYK